jgi:hypothetical protein
MTTNPFYCSVCGGRGKCTMTRVEPLTIVRKYRCTCGVWKTQESMLTECAPVPPPAIPWRQRVATTWLERINRQLAECTALPGKPITQPTTQPKK